MLAHILGQETEEVDQMQVTALETLHQFGVLRRHAHRAGVKVALADHLAAQHDQCAGGKSVLLGSEQRADDDIAARLELTVDLQRHLAAQIVQHERLLHLRQTYLGRQAGMLDRTHGAGARTAVTSADEDHVGLGLGDARGDGADTTF